MSKKPAYEILFMPWADLHQEYSCGPFRFVPWSRATVRNAKVKKFLDRYFKRHVDDCGNPVDGVAIVTTDASFEPLSKRLIEQARAAVDMFVFAAIAPGVAAGVRSDNPSLGPPTADAYKLFLQRFDPSDDTIAVTVGSSTHVSRVERMVFHKPLDVGASAGFPDHHLFQGLARLLTRKVKADVRKRLCRSLEWFRLAHAGGDDVSLFSKAVMMATAFEILFRIPEGPGKTRNFITAVEKQLNRQDTLKATRTVSRKAKTFDRTQTLPGWWADDFYDLRSRVVHGDPVDVRRLRYERWISHLIVADLVFWQSLVQELRTLECCPADVRGVYRTGGREFVDSMLGFQRVNQKLGWRPMKTKK